MTTLNIQVKKNVDVDDNNENETDDVDVSFFIHSFIHSTLIHHS